VAWNARCQICGTSGVESGQAVGWIGQEIIGVVEDLGGDVDGLAVSELVIARSCAATVSARTARPV